MVAKLRPDCLQMLRLGSSAEFWGLQVTSLQLPLDRGCHEVFSVVLSAFRCEGKQLVVV